MSTQNSTITCEVIENWFQLAILAPSGANLQPWSYSGVKLEKENYQITLKLDPEYLGQPSSMDPNFIAATAALGAFAENLEIAAKFDGFIVSRFEHSGDSPGNWKWIFDFQKNRPIEVSDKSLLSAIKNRVSNRNTFYKTPISEADWQTTEEKLKNNSTLFLYRTKPEHKYAILKVLRILENIRCKDATFRSEMFKEFSTMEELQQNQTGLPINTITNSFFEREIIKILKKWPKFQKLLSYGGQFLFIKSSVDKPIKNSGDICILQSQNLNSNAGFELGRILEKLWLHWTLLGYSAQILALPLLINGADKLPRHRKKIEEANLEVKKNLKLDFRLPTFIIRIGKATKMAEHSPRRTG